jgi:hypothetical protein
MVAFGLIAATTTPTTSGGVEVGDLVEYTFRSDFLGEPGPGAIKDLRGKPVLIDFWGTR